MEDTMTAQHHSIRRRFDGSIDIDFYRQRGLMARRAVMTDFFKGMATGRKPLVAAAVIVAALYMSPARDGTRWNGPSASSPRPNSASLISPMSAAQSAHVVRMLGNPEN
jgi:hypothetical protein